MNTLLLQCTGALICIVCGLHAISVLQQQPVEDQLFQDGEYGSLSRLVCCAYGSSFRSAHSCERLSAGSYVQKPSQSPEDSGRWM